MKRKNEKKDNKDKISILRIISNNFYILKYGFKQDKLLVFLVFSAFITVSITWAYSSSSFLKLVIECYQDQTIGVYEAAKTIIKGCAIIILGDLVEYGLDFYIYPRFAYLAGKIQSDMFKKATDMDLICYDHTEYYDNFVIAAKQCEDMITEGIIVTANIAGATVMMSMLGGFILTLNPVLAVFPAIGFAINTFATAKGAVLNYEYDMERRRIMRKADYSKRVFYQPEYAKEIKLSHIEVPLKRQFDEAIEEVTAEAKKKGRMIAIINLIDWITVYTLLSYCFPPIFLGYLALKKKSIQLGEVASLNSAQNNFRNSLNHINYSILEFQKVGQSAEKFRKFMEYEIHTEKQPGQEVASNEPETLIIRDMSYRYEGAKKDTLHHINMTVRPGEKIAIVGENGAGKTTFVKLLMRLYDVTEGSIEYGGRDIREYATDSYRKIFGTVFQDFQLYAASLGDNVLMEQYDKKEEEKVRNALLTADFGKRLEKMEHGIETEMTREFHEEGTMLSGGESQKVAIARLFAKNQKMSVAILDEPSSALDPKAEFILNQNMMEKSEDATVIFISHRLSTTRDADCIYMFEHGEIVEQGTHEQLMNLNGRYAMMFEKQAHYYKEAI